MRHRVDLRWGKLIYSVRVKSGGFFAVNVEILQARGSRSFIIDGMNRTVGQFERACRSLAGGVSSSTRVNRALGHPMYFARGQGCRVWDLDGKEYLDLCCSHGATLLGHGDPRVHRAVDAA